MNYQNEHQESLFPETEYRMASFGQRLAASMIHRPQATETIFGVNLAIYLFVAVVVGGAGILSGAIPGALLYVFVPYYTAQWATHLSILEGRLVAPADFLYGVLLLVVVFLLPGGFMHCMK